MLRGFFYVDLLDGSSKGYSISLQMHKVRDKDGTLLKLVTV